MNQIKLFPPSVVFVKYYVIVRKIITTCIKKIHGDMVLVPPPHKKTTGYRLSWMLTIRHLLGFGGVRKSAKQLLHTVGQFPDPAQH